VQIIIVEIILAIYEGLRDELGKISFSAHTSHHTVHQGFDLFKLFDIDSLIPLFSQLCTLL
jgi:hypothetical protein